MVCGLIVALQPLWGLTQQNSGVSKTAAQQTATERAGQHDFDFELGNWKIHLKQLLHPLTGSTTWSILTALRLPEKFGMAVLNLRSSKPIALLPATSKV